MSKVKNDNPDKKKLNEYETKLEEFYKLKNKYEQKKSREIQKLIANTKLSIREKKIKFRETSNQCINCKKKGGTIFERKSDYFRVTCGNTEKPCSLNLQFQRQRRDLLTEKIIDYIGILQQSKEAIIRLKLEYLMGFISEEDSIVEFTTLKKKLETEYDVYRELVERFHKIVDNLDNADDITTKLSERQETINTIKKHIIKYRQTDNRAEITEAVEIYIGDLNRLIQELQTLQYKHQYIEFVEEGQNDVAYLIKQEYGLRDLEIQK